MELNEFLKHFKDQFEDTDPETISSDTVYKELDEWSSLTAFAIIAMVKTQYGKMLTGAEIKECRTVADLFNCVSKK